MGLKELIGYCLIIAGIGFLFLLLGLLLDIESINHDFFIYLGGLALIAFFLGIFILKKSE